jgi:hypothetical protein
VLLGNGNGTFQPAKTYETGGFYSTFVAVGDVNHDGNPDLLVVNEGNPTNTVGVLLGNADGTFRQPLTYASTGSMGGGLSVAVADLNGDGNPDLVVANDYPDSAGRGTLGVFLGNGDGTFQTAVSYDSGGHQDLSVTVADVNGDGKPDLIVTNIYSVGQADGNGTVGVLLGNGDWTFQPALTFGSGGPSAWFVAVADVNGDGKPDILVANSCATSDCGNGSVGVLLNQTPSPYKAIVQPPIDADGSSVFKANRGVLPVIFILNQNNAQTCALPAATIAVTRTAAGTLGPVDESIFSIAADNGSNFRIDASACQYIYNLAASSLGVGTYRVDIRINGFVAGNAVFVLK